jgi:Protein of unknown function (DUF4435)
LVEGESDIRLFRKLFNLANCNVECIPGGNTKLEECVSVLSGEHSLLIGIRDADFLQLSANPYTRVGMLMTDFHDIEMMLISEDEIFQSLCHECTSLDIQDQLKVRDHVFQILQEISFLKLLNYTENLEFVFTPGFIDLISLGTMSVDFSMYLSRVIGKSPNARLNNEIVINEKIDALKAKKPNLFFLTNGHDFIKTLTHYVNKGKNGAYTSDMLTGALRMSYTTAHFKKTLLYKAISEWSSSKKCSILN